MGITSTTNQSTMLPTLLTIASIVFVHSMTIPIPDKDETSGSGAPSGESPVVHFSEVKTTLILEETEFSDDAITTDQLETTVTEEPKTIQSQVWNDHYEEEQSPFQSFWSGITPFFNSFWTRVPSLFYKQQSSKLAEMCDVHAHFC